MLSCFASASHVSVWRGFDAGVLDQAVPFWTLSPVPSCLLVLLAEKDTFLVKTVMGMSVAALMRQRLR